MNKKLNEIPLSYLLSRNQKEKLGDVACHFYIEINGNFDYEKVKSAWKDLFFYHNCLNQITDENGNISFLEKNASTVLFADFSSYENEVQKSYLQKFRAEFSKRKLNVQYGQNASLVYVKTEAEKSLLLFDIDLLCADVVSFQIILNDFMNLYENGTVKKSAKKIDYILEKGEKPQEIEYKIPELELKASPQKFYDCNYNCVNCFCNPKNKEFSFILACYAFSLYKVNEKNKNFVLNVPLFIRPENQENNTGDFTSLKLIQIKIPQSENFNELVLYIQKQLIQTKENEKGLSSLLELKKDSEALFAPYVFSYTPQISLPAFDFQNMISQTPGVLLDAQFYCYKEGLFISFVYPKELFERKKIEELMDVLKKELSEKGE